MLGDTRPKGEEDATEKLEIIVRERFEDPQSPETQDMGSYRDSEKA